MIENVKFTAQEALEATEFGDPILISAGTALVIMTKRHQYTAEDYREFLLETGISDLEPIDAGLLFQWLGY